MWDRETRAHRQFGTHGEFVGNIQISADEKHLISGGLDGTVRLWDVATGLGKTIRTQEGGVYSIAILPDGTLLASAGKGNSLQVGNVSANKSVLALPISHDHSDSRFELYQNSDGILAFSPKGDKIALAGSDKTVHVYDLFTKQHVTFSGHTGAVRHVAFSPDGTLLASGSFDKSLRIWDLASTHVSVQDAHQGGVISRIRRSKDQSSVALAFWDGNFRIWRPAEGIVSALRGHVSTVSDLQLATDGRSLVSVGADRTLKVWATSSGEYRDAARFDGDPGTLSLSQTINWLPLARRIRK